MLSQFPADVKATVPALPAPAILAEQHSFGSNARTARSGHGPVHRPHISSAAKGALRAAWKRAALKQYRPLFLRAPYASLNRMALLRANPENKFGYPERVFYMRLPCPHCPRKDSNIVINL
jgi:hypothetical protein